jgi:hypothetical protein
MTSKRSVNHQGIFLHKYTALPNLVDQGKQRMEVSCIHPLLGEGGGLYKQGTWTFKADRQNLVTHEQQLWRDKHNVSYDCHFEVISVILDRPVPCI